MQKSLTTKHIRHHKKEKNHRNLSMLTCYDFQTAQLLNDTDLDMILVGDSLGNVVLGFDSTIPVSLDNMILFGQAVRKGAPEKFLVLDLPFGSTNSYEVGLENACKLFQQTGAQAVKLEGAYADNLKIIKRLTEIGVAVMGHIGLTPQSVHQLGGYYTHGKTQHEHNELLNQAKLLEAAGIFSLVLECVQKDVAKSITENISIPTIGIGSGEHVDGQVLVINDLFHQGKNDPPKFCTPVANFYELKKNYLLQYLTSLNPPSKSINPEGLHAAPLS